MVVKVTVSLPGNAQISVEAEEAEILREVVGLALRELPRDLMRLGVEGAAQATQSGGGKNVPPSLPEAGGPGSLESETDDPQVPEEITGAEQLFARFCGEVAAIGDMRRVVVAAEGAKRFLGIEAVSADELGRLYGLARWRRPANDLQTLRNAARSTFRWLERVPGEPGYYAVTQVGRDEVIAAGQAAR